jgi:ABC-type Fe3+/spermidine/putrescine transport system ATPase subunit
MLRGFGTTAVLVTHDLAEACHLADQLVVYDRGQVLQAGVKADVLSRPASVAVAQVLGIRNILEGELLEAGRGTVRLAWRGHELVAECESGRGDLPRPGGRIAFYIRPEHVHLLRKDRPAAEAGRRTNLIRGVITGETDLGAVVLLRFRVEGDGPDPPSGYDLEIEVARLVHEKLCVHYDRQWEATVQPGAVQLLPNPPG